VDYAINLVKLSATFMDKGTHSIPVNAEENVESKFYQLICYKKIHAYDNRNFLFVFLENISRAYVCFVVYVCW
jgi:hypothetical protein